MIWPKIEIAIKILITIGLCYPLLAFVLGGRISDQEVFKRIAEVIGYLTAVGAVLAGVGWVWAEL